MHWSEYFTMTLILVSGWLCCLVREADALIFNLQPLGEISHMTRPCWMICAHHSVAWHVK